ncbi:Uma2 family endonuclease [Deinococcus multiflagellatus]|uniref:Uma2 family endonuclease n=1 Tax=Deinococcus multiflagellatus TaxID=1656887 RepID=A0ABW1ZMJ9_9DEIO|nr:Uma2 family endonuclease [Deinococcus multiflagellatus]MBZ9715108.1 Uma2 family endonuclease [Deinococcus multiflagellatus]
MTDSPLKKISEAEYLRTEEVSPFKREYVDGFVYALHGEDGPVAQAGATSKHGLLCTNLVAALHRPARQKGCRVYVSDMRVRADALGTRYYYPDLVLTCEDMADEARYTEAPCFIAEVLSLSTRDTDRREKLWAYQQLPSLQGYLLVDTATRAVRLYRRDAEGWRDAYAEGQGQITLPCVDLTLSLDEIYDGVNL